jgi:hypothetical protein
MPRPRLGGLSLGEVRSATGRNGLDQRSTMFHRKIAIGIRKIWGLTMQTAYDGTNTNVLKIQKCHPHIHIQLFFIEEKE